MFIGYKTILRRGNQSGIGFAAGTTAEACIFPEIVAQADPTMLLCKLAAAIAAAVLVSAVLAPLFAAWVLKRQGGLAQETVKGEKL